MADAALSIRPLAAADRAAWDPLWRGYLDFYRASVPARTTDVTFARLTGGEEPMGGFLAERDGRAVGLVHWILHRSTWTEGPYCYLQDLFTAPEARGLGAGRALIERVYAHAERAGASRVYWLTHETNDTAMALYDKVADRSGFLQYRKLFPQKPG